MKGIFNILIELFQGTIYFFIAILLVLVLRRLLSILIKNTVIRKKVLFYLPAVEFIIFFSILIGTAYALVSADKIVGSVIVLILMFSVSKFLKNYVSGIVFRLSNRNITGSIVEIDDTIGRVSAYLMTSIAIKNQKEEVIKVPYVLFYNKYKTASINTESTVKISFVFTFDTLEARVLEEKIKSLLLNSNWVVLSKEISVDYSISSKQLLVDFYSLSNTYEMEIRKSIENLL